MTLQIPEEDRHSYTRDMLVSHIKVLMGGRAAEELIYKTTTTGAGNDLARATDACPAPSGAPYQCVRQNAGHLRYFFSIGQTF